LRDFDIGDGLLNRRLDRAGKIIPAALLRGIVAVRLFPSVFGARIHFSGLAVIRDLNVPLSFIFKGPE